MYLKVGVNVGLVITLRDNESEEQQSILDWVYVCCIQSIVNQGTGTTSSTRPHANTLSNRVLYKVSKDDEVFREARTDNVEFLLEPSAVLWKVVEATLLQTLPGHACQLVSSVLIARRLWKQVQPLVIRVLANHARDDHRVVDSLVADS